MNELWGAPKRVNVIQMSLGENKRVPPLKSKESRWRRPTWRASSGVREGVNVLVFCSEFPQKFNAAFKTGSRLAGEYTSAAAALHLRHPLAKLPNLDKDLYANSEGKKENTGFRMEFREMATAIMRNETFYHGTYRETAPPPPPPGTAPSYRCRPPRPGWPRRPGPRPAGSSACCSAASPAGSCAGSGRGSAATGTRSASSVSRAQSKRRHWRRGRLDSEGLGMFAHGTAQKH